MGPRKLNKVQGKYGEDTKNDGSGEQLIEFHTRFQPKNIDHPFSTKAYSQLHMRATNTTPKINYRLHNYMTKTKRNTTRVLS